MSTYIVTIYCDIKSIFQTVLTHIVSSSFSELQPGYTKSTVLQCGTTKNLFRETSFEKKVAYGQLYNVQNVSLLCPTCNILYRISFIFIYFRATLFYMWETKLSNGCPWEKQPPKSFNTPSQHESVIHSHMLFKTDSGSHPLLALGARPNPKPEQWRM